MEKNLKGGPKMRLSVLMIRLLAQASDKGGFGIGAPGYAYAFCGGGLLSART
jgi:hypothetical protein